MSKAGLNSVVVENHPYLTDKWNWETFKPLRDSKGKVLKESSKVLNIIFTNTKRIKKRLQKEGLWPW